MGLQTCFETEPRGSADRVAEAGVRWESQMTVATKLMPQIHTYLPKGGSYFPLWRLDQVVGSVARDTPTSL